MEIKLPNNDWKPRRQQMPLWRYLEGGGKRASAVWHRRFGKDEVCLHWSACAAHMRVGNYWHMLPEAAQARKAIWNAVNPHTGIRRIDEVFPEQLRATTRDQEMMISFKNGSTWQLVGSDNYNSLVGAPPIGLVFSEWALANPAAWAFMRPILLENNGWVVFIGTPRGHNHAKVTHDLAMDDPDWFGQTLTADDTDIFTPKQLAMEKRELVALYGDDIGTSMFEQEYYASFNAAILGAYFSQQVKRMREKKRINPDVDFIPGLPVHTWWDLGINDPTVIHFVQFDGPRILIPDVFASTGASMADYAGVLEDKRKEHGIIYGAHIGPHDLMKREYAGQTVKDLAADLGIEFDVSPKLGKVDSIQHVRRMLDRCWINEDRCATTVSALEQHHSEYDEKSRAFTLNPVHDWTSHYIDSIKYGAQMPSYAFSRTWETDTDEEGWGGSRQSYDEELDRCAI